VSDNVNLLKEGFKKKRQFIFLSVFFLSLFGLLMVYSASGVYAFRLYNDALYFFKRQLLFFCGSLVVFFITLLINVDILRKHNKKIFIFNLLLLVLVLVVGRRVGGAKRWLEIGSFSFQPSEFLKLSFLLYACGYFFRKGKRMRDFKEGVLPFLCVACLVFLLVVLEPDFGTVIFWLIWILFMFFLVRVKTKHIMFIMIFGLVASLVLVKADPYRFRRLLVFLNPWEDPQGSGFQIVQSQIAFGEGGLFGVGLGEGKQKLFFLPAAHTDFIFSMIAEEFGLIGSLSVLLLYFFIFIVMLRISCMIGDEFFRYFCIGLSVMFGLEIVINVGVSCGFFPTKGIALPFVSYGGTNLLVHYLLLGVFFNVSRVYEDYPSMR